MALVSVLQGEWLDAGLRLWIEYDNANNRAIRLHWTNTTALTWAVSAVRRSDARRYSATVAPGTGSLAIPQNGAGRWDLSVDVHGQLDAGVEVRPPRRG